MTSKKEEISRSDAPENAFRDLSARSNLFRKRLIEEFQLLDNIGVSASGAPIHSSSEFIDPGSRRSILMDNPMQPIKFKVFRRQQLLDDGPKLDRRLIRTKNLNSWMIGAWAGWVVKNKYFQDFLLSIILINSIFLGISADLQSHEEHYIGLFRFIRILDLFTLIVFISEIFLKWGDDFKNYWKDGWNIFDFTITLITALPELIEAAGSFQGSAFLSAIAGELRTLRILRTFKTIVRFGSLKIIILTIIQTLKSMSYILLLLLIVAYIYAVFGVNIYKGYSKDPDTGDRYREYFDSVGNSLMSLFQLLTLDEWDNINRSLAGYANPVTSQLFILSWVFLGAFIFRNIFVGVMVNNFEKISSTLKEKKAEYLKARKFQKMRKRLNKELAVQGTIQKSITNLNKDATTGTKDGEAKSELNMEDLLKMGQKDRNLFMEETLGSIEEAIRKIQSQFRASRDSSKHWLEVITEHFSSLSAKNTEVMWPRDTLFKYLQLMEALQENMREYQELQLLAAATLLDIHDE